MRKALTYAEHKRRYLTHPKGQRCECGNRAEVNQSGYWICERCWRLDVESRRDAVIGLLCPTEPKPEPVRPEPVAAPALPGWGSLERLRV